MLPPPNQEVNTTTFRPEIGRQQLAEITTPDMTTPAGDIRRFSPSWMRWQGLSGNSTRYSEYIPTAWYMSSSRNNNGGSR